MRWTAGSGGGGLLGREGQGCLVVWGFFLERYKLQNCSFCLKKDYNLWKKDSVGAATHAVCSILDLTEKKKRKGNPSQTALQSLNKSIFLAWSNRIPWKKWSLAKKQTNKQQLAQLDHTKPCCTAAADLLVVPPAWGRGGIQSSSCPGGPSAACSPRPPADELCRRARRVSVQGDGRGLWGEWLKMYQRGL